VAYNVAVDVGGTFTDVLVFNEGTGQLTDTKVLSTTEDPSEGVVTGIERVCEKVGIAFPDLRLLFHGAMVVTNMILTNTGARVGGRYRNRNRPKRWELSSLDRDNTSCNR
jgi:N-methylhydantoinase A